eukprot:scaffold85532_cov35-Tisochrysis_lutea.AAC.2
MPLPLLIIVAGPLWARPTVRRDAASHEPFLLISRNGKSTSLGMGMTEPSRQPEPRVMHMRAQQPPKAAIGRPTPTRSHMHPLLRRVPLMPGVHEEERPRASTTSMGE